jgi:hypothetical protein
MRRVQRRAALVFEGADGGGIEGGGRGLAGGERGARPSDATLRRARLTVVEVAKPQEPAEPQLWWWYFFQQPQRGQK